MICFTCSFALQAKIINGAHSTTKWRRTPPDDQLMEFPWRPCDMPRKISRNSGNTRCCAWLVFFSRSRPSRRLSQPWNPRSACLRFFTRKKSKFASLDLGSVGMQTVPTFHSSPPPQLRSIVELCSGCVQLWSFLRTLRGRRSARALVSTFSRMLWPATFAIAVQSRFWCTLWASTDKPSKVSPSSPLLTSLSRTLLTFILFIEATAKLFFLPQLHDLPNWTFYWLMRQAAVLTLLSSRLTFNGSMNVSGVSQNLFWQAKISADFCRLKS